MNSACMIMHNWLTDPLHAKVWLNLPYGTQELSGSHGLRSTENGISLVPARAEVEARFWPFMWEAADALLFRRGRIRFRLPDGSTKGNAKHGSVVAAYGRKNAERRRESGMVGRYVELRPDF